MKDVHQLFQAFVAPAIFVSAEGLLLLSLNVRLMGIVSRLRSHLHKKHDAAQQSRFAESDAYALQIASIEARAEMIRRAFVLTLYGLIGTIVACLLLGAGLYWSWAEWSTTPEKFEWRSVRCGRKQRIRDSWICRIAETPGIGAKRPAGCRVS
jgi:hypothetical protein